MLVLGIGNVLLQDDGIGVHVLRFMEKHFSVFPNVRYKNANMPNGALAKEISQHRHVLLLDAVEIHAPPGTVCYYENDELDDFLSQSEQSLHHTKLRHLLSDDSYEEPLNHYRALIGIQYGTLACGREPTVAVRANIPLAGRIGATVLQKWELEAHPPYPIRKPVALRLVAN